LALVLSLKIEGRIFNEIKKQQKNNIPSNKTEANNKANNHQRFLFACLFSPTHSTLLLRDFSSLIFWGD
jgi:hypothetical protein